ncbi:MAG TPA: serine O-acetyltransferase, partial [Alphaproteobacteria bacterium]|nr:serine O-acetyltransferase [Alphaproteobacteria bacterium]
PTAEIGAGLCLPHPTGIVIGQVVKIGADVTLYQNVTLGSARAGGANDQPEIGNNVVIFAGAVIVGKISIGPNAKIGANAVVLDHVPAGAAAVGAPARIIESPFSFEQAA